MLRNSAQALDVYNSVFLNVDYYLAEHEFFENIKIRWLSNWGGDLSVEYCSLLLKLLRTECHLGGFLLCSAFLVENEMTWILKQTDPRTWEIPIYTYNVGLSFRGMAGI